MHWDSHVNSVCKKISSIPGVMNRFGNSVDKSTLNSIYYAHVNSHISYLLPIWGNSTTQNLLNSLQVSQNQAIRSLFRRDYFAHGLSTQQIREKYNILSIQQNVRYGMALLAFRIKRGLIKNDIQLNTNEQRHSHSTRTAGNIYQQTYRTNSGKHLTSRIIAVEYNNLPPHLKNSRSIFHGLF